MFLFLISVHVSASEEHQKKTRFRVEKSEAGHSKGSYEEDTGKMHHKRKKHDRLSIKPQEVELKDKTTQGRDSMDCVMSDWTSWSPCSTTCGQSYKYKRRIVKQHPVSGGKNCPRKLEKKRRCKVEHCRKCLLLFLILMLDTQNTSLEVTSMSNTDGGDQDNLGCDSEIYYTPPLSSTQKKEPTLKCNKKLPPAS